MSGTSAALRSDPVRLPEAGAAGADLYGGLVGGMMGEIEARLAAPDAAGPVGEDVFHRLSVGVGYLGFAAAFVATAAVIGSLL